MAEALRQFKVNRCCSDLCFAFMLREGDLIMFPRGWSCDQVQGPERFDDTGENPSCAPRKYLKGK